MTPSANTTPVEPVDGFGVAILDRLGNGDTWPPGVAALLSHLSSARSAQPSNTWERTAERSLSTSPPRVAWFETCSNYS
jgi:hypothetical protein